MNISHIISSIILGIGIGVWIQIGQTKYYEYKNKVLIWKQKSEWYDEDKKEKE